ncbi:MAG: sigma-70 family RNA polymerase sigma factor [Myxococcaceae bacterium]|nr:sigma-70 family RNA polymerase sigma factor [Myxococcaceae bacterium]
MRRFRDFDAAEDAVQDALVAAAQAWTRGQPDDPRAWLIQVAFRRLTDQARADSARRRREDEHGSDLQREFEADVPAADPGDDTLLLLFMCCHPALSGPSQVALTLRAVCGLTTAEIAKAFLVPEATMAQRISRAKQTVRESGVPFRRPGPDEWPARLAQVLHALYLVFNEGYTTSFGEALHRSELTDEALRLARDVHRALPDEPEVTGLLALMLLTDARRPARTDAAGELVPLHEQDRTKWDAAAIAEGVALISSALPRGQVGPYQLQAAIAAVHDEAKTAADTDWPQILALYRVLERVAPNPMVTLSACVALAMVHGPATGLERLEVLAHDKLVGEHLRLEAVRAHLLEMAGDVAAAAAAYARAAEKTESAPEKRYLLSRASRLR